MDHLLFSRIVFFIANNDDRQLWLIAKTRTTLTAFGHTVNCIFGLAARTNAASVYRLALNFMSVMPVTVSTVSSRLNNNRFLDLGNIRVAPPRFRRENLIASESTRFNRPLSIQTGSPVKQYDARI